MFDGEHRRHSAPEGLSLPRPKLNSVQLSQVITAADRGSPPGVSLEMDHRFGPGRGGHRARPDPPVAVDDPEHFLEEGDGIHEIEDIYIVPGGIKQATTDVPHPAGVN